MSHFQPAKEQHLLHKAFCHTVQVLRFHALIHSLDDDSNEHTPEARLLSIQALLFSSSIQALFFEHFVKLTFYLIFSSARISVLSELNFS